MRRVHILIEPKALLKTKYVSFIIHLVAHNFSTHGVSFEHPSLLLGPPDDLTPEAALQCRVHRELGLKLPIRT